jgi:hypothetical protein
MHTVFIPVDGSENDLITDDGDIARIGRPTADESEISRTGCVVHLHGVRVVGGIASFACQYFFNLSDIILDLNTKQPKGNILDWQSEDVDFNMFNEKQQHINYKSYTMGLRHEQLKNVSNEK